MNHKRVDRGPQELAYDFWWHLGHDTLISSEWGIPNRLENGLDPEHLLASGYGAIGNRRGEEKGGRAI